MTTTTKPIQPAMPLPHLTAAGLFISHTGSFGAQRVAECSEEYAAAEIARRTNAYPRLLADNERLRKANDEFSKEHSRLATERAELVAALRALIDAGNCSRDGWIERDQASSLLRRIEGAE